MKVTTIDQMGRTVEVPDSPKRIISLVPSQTELLIDLGLPVIGRTKFCIHPADKVKDILIIGGTKHFHFDRIRALQPDLIIGNKEENYPEGISQLEKEYPVWMSDIVTLEDALDMIRKVAALGSVREEGGAMADQLAADLASIKNTFSGKVLYLIWKKPWMTAGRQTFIHSMLTHLGFENVITADRYPELTDQQLANLSPDYLFLSSEPFPFQEADVLEVSEKWDVQARLVDGEMFSWYGSRLLTSVGYFKWLATSLP